MQILIFLNILDINHPFSLVCILAKISEFCISNHFDHRMQLKAFEDEAITN